MKVIKTRFSINFIKENQGIAMIMVLGIISLLTFLLADFTFTTKLNKIKVYNQQDKAQARLNAESGLNFALAKLRLYQEGRNKIEKEESIKSAFPIADLESVIIQPFIYPIPTSSKMNVIQRSALEEFNKKTIFKGEVSVTFNKISGLLNPNSLRIPIAKPTTTETKDDEAALPNDAIESESDGGDNETEGDNTDLEKSKKNEKPHLIIEDKFVETLERVIKEKSDNDEEFHSKYSNLNIPLLIKEIKFYVNTPNQFQDQEKQEIENRFSQKNITPKHAPMTSLDELYVLPSWDDTIVDLIKNRLSIHETSTISINEITSDDLKIIFPNINNIQIEDFFKYRDGDPDKKIQGKKFKSADEFKSAVTGELGIVTESEYEDRIKKLKSAGLTIQTAGKLYKITSRGSYNNATYTLVAFVDLPIKPAPPEKKKKSKTPTPDDSNPAKVNPSADSDSKEEKPKPIELLPPRVIELRLE